MLIDNSKQQRGLSLRPGTRRENSTATQEIDDFFILAGKCKKNRKQESTKPSCHTRGLCNTIQKISMVLENPKVITSKPHIGSKKIFVNS